MNYRIVGGDGAEYGPVSGEQLREWFADGRLVGETRVLREGESRWQPFSATPEFADLFPSAAVLVPPPVSSPPPFAPPPSGPPPPVSGIHMSLQATAPGLAMASLALGVLGLIPCCVCAPVTCLPAIVCGHLARAQIRKSRGALGGDGAALAGLALGYLSLLLMLLLAAIAVPAFVKARGVAQTSTCSNNLRMIDTAKEEWALAHKAATGDTIPGGLSALVGNDGYIKQSPVCPKGGTYMVNPIGKDPTCSVKGHALNIGFPRPMRVALPLPPPPVPPVPPTVAPGTEPQVIDDAKEKGADPAGGPTAER